MWDGSIRYAAAMSTNTTKYSQSQWFRKCGPSGSDIHSGSPQNNWDYTHTHKKLTKIKGQEVQKCQDTHGIN